MTWDAALDSIGAAGSPRSTRLRLFHLRDRASLFGYNAPQPQDPVGRAARELRRNIRHRRPEYGDDPGRLDILAVERHTRPARRRSTRASWRDGWVVLMRAVRRPAPLPHHRRPRRRAHAVRGQRPRQRCLTLERPRRSSSTRSSCPSTAASRSMAAAKSSPSPTRRCHDLVGGNSIELDRRVDGLPEERKLILRGPRAQARVADSGSVDRGGGRRAARRHARRGRSHCWPRRAAAGRRPTLLWTLRDADGFTGVAEAEPADLLAVPAAKTCRGDRRGRRPSTRARDRHRAQRP